MFRETLFCLQNVLAFFLFLIDTSIHYVKYQSDKIKWLLLKVFSNLCKWFAQYIAVVTTFTLFLILIFWYLSHYYSDQTNNYLWNNTMKHYITNIFSASTMLPSNTWSMMSDRGKPVPSMSSWKVNSNLGSISPRRALRSHSSLLLCKCK